MKDGSMFAALLNYADISFWEAHPTIRFDTLEETGTYQVLAAFYEDVSLTEDGVAFPSMNTRIYAMMPSSKSISP